VKYLLLSIIIMTSCGTYSSLDPSIYVDAPNLPCIIGTRDNPVTVSTYVPTNKTIEEFATLYAPEMELVSYTILSESIVITIDKEGRTQMAIPISLTFSPVDLEGQ
jgi:hypothetical protein